jgi:hypothetical protein
MLLLSPRVGHYGKLATECATTYYNYGCALLYKAREVTDHTRNVHKETANEESGKSEDYDENSKTSATNVEDAPLEKVNSDEGNEYPSPQTLIYTGKNYYPLYVCNRWPDKSHLFSSVHTYGSVYLINC